MRRVSVVALSVIAFGALSGSAAYAGGPSDIMNSNNQVSLDFVETNFDYRESDPNGVFPVLDSEKGWVPGVSVTASAMHDFLGIPNLYAMGRVTYLNGSTSYWAAVGPVTSNTDGAQVWDEDFRLGVGFNLNNQAMLTPYVGAGHHLWGRNLSGPSGYHEDYSDSYVGGGLLLQVQPVSRLVLSANGLIGSTINASMTTSRTPGGFPITPFTYALGSSTIFMVGASADYAVTERIHANLGVDYVDYKYGQSPMAPDGSLEPSSQTSNVTVRVGLGFALGGEPSHVPLK